MFITRSLLLSSVIALAGCAGSPSAPSPADQEAKRFDQPAPARGALYVYRSGFLGLARPIDVAVVGGVNAQLGYNTFIRIEGPPGPVEVDCRVGDNTGKGQVQVQDGQTRFVEISMKVGLWLPGCEVVEVAPDVGQAAVRSSRRVEPQ